ncbi:Concanavalin A-like lectin/glucanase, subgroup [Moelleriella libera RCEF 2490]|uniref:Concanavalin A-like lectin/glucanase, subgroup n=1 Tax=Moelleriella libera RCEF 2490 TaxID=1081109 RepID=A0A166ULD0_9HYPO|nr:Concanavalin A-like lectin/glucanase, subgroup [Moelleriella libera RCEF 2490]
MRPHSSIARKVAAGAATASPLPLILLSSWLLGSASGQTFSRCNPLQQQQCPANTALGMTIDVDFRQGAVNSFAASGSPRYSASEGVSFTVSQAGDAPQLQSLFYIMFGRVEMTARAAAGAGIVSSLVLESDDLDELDMEWLGAAAGELQTNYFGKGQTTTYNRGQFHAVADTQARWVRSSSSSSSGGGGNGNGAIPDGWYMTPSGKIMKKNSASAAAASPLRQPITPFPGLSVLTMTMTMMMSLAVVIPTLLSGL